MVKEGLTDEKIADLLHLPKWVKNPSVKPRIEGKHKRCDYKVESQEGGHQFLLFTRQSLKLVTSFSTGLRWLPHGEEGIMLMRCNGPSHEHLNAIEGERISFACHIHMATERYWSAGKREEGFAEIATEYTDLNGALLWMIRRCNILGFITDYDAQTLLFDDQDGN